MQHGMSPREKDSYRHGINEGSTGCLSKADSCSYDANGE
jgi:hypothetical protein